MKSSMKVSTLTYLRLPNLLVNCHRIQQEQRSKSRSGIEILLCLFAPVLFCVFPVVSVASPVQKIAQASPRVGVNRPSLKVGSQGEVVSELQAALKLLGFYTGAVDGVYNEGTAIAVSRFQQAAGLNQDGVVDTNTWQRLFPSESIASSSVSPNSTSRFPVPSQTSNSNTVVVPYGEQRTTTTTTSTNRAVNLKPEPKPTTTPTTRTVNSESEPRPTTTRTRVATNSSDRTISSTNSRQTTRTQPTDRSESTSRSSTRTQTPRSRSSTRTQQTAYIQQTSDGLPILRPGMRGSEVVRLQRRLQRLGYLEEGDIDGDFGATTAAAIISLQKRYGLEADGVVGGATWEILNRRRGR